MQPKARVLVVDDHAEMARLLGDQLGDAGYEVELATSGVEALALARRQPPDLVFTDLRMEGVDGLDVLDQLRRDLPGTPVVIMTAFGAVETAIEAIRRGAYHYLVKPFRLEEVLLYAERALADRRLREEHRALLQVAGERSGFPAMIGGGPASLALHALLARIAPSGAPVLVRGESGSGKELVARALHFEGPRRERSFVAVNCTALPEALLESELFGHLRGAFTGATAARRGLFVEADGGTLFLDEIGDMAPGLQAKLLRALEDREVRAVGADTARAVDVRIVAATHHDLEERVKAGAFRADLFYRLNVVPVRVPPLRERREDIPALLDHFLSRALSRNQSSPVRRLGSAVRSALCAAPWPGNVRELENVVERLVIVSTVEEVSLEELSLHAPGLTSEASPLAAARAELKPLRQVEGDYIAWVVARCGGNKTRAAELLEIDVSTIHRREREKPGGAS